MAPARASDPAGDVFSDVVADHVRRIQRRVPEAVADSPDGVHRLRTAVRRLRTVLAVYRPVFDRDEADALRDRLAVLGRVLGDARDLEVRRDDVESVGRSARVSLGARARLVAALDAEHAAAHARVVEWFGGPAWADLTADLVRWVSDPPLGDAAGKRARQVARKRLRKATAKALRAADDVDLTALADLGPTAATEGEGSGPGDDELMVRAHRLRKAGRRVAHAAKAVTHQPTHVLGSSARELGRAGKQVQSTLGDHRDAVLLARHVRRAGDAVEHDGGDRAPYDRLAAAADRRARDSLDRAAAAITRLRDTAAG